MPVDEAGRSGPVTWRTIFATEPAEQFVGFGTPVLAPVSGTVVARHDAEPDHRAHRSLGAGLPYLLTQPRRLRQGVEAVVGNHVVLAVATRGPFVLLAHLQRGSLAVGMGQRVQAGEVVAACGNSGNSTQPHVHLHAMDSLDWQHARGLPIAFRRPDGSGAHLPAEREIVRA